MKPSVGIILFALSLVLLASCAPAPTTVQPTQTVVDLPFEEAYSRVVTAIATQPYPSDSGGWVITQSDQTGGLVSARLSGQHPILLGIGLQQYTNDVTILLTRLTEDTTRVSMSFSTSYAPARREAESLMASVRSALAID